MKNSLTTTPKHFWVISHNNNKSFYSIQIEDLKSDLVNKYPYGPYILIGEEDTILNLCREEISDHYPKELPDTDINLLISYIQRGQAVNPLKDEVVGLFFVKSKPQNKTSIVDFIPLYKDYIISKVLVIDKIK